MGGYAVLLLLMMMMMMIDEGGGGEQRKWGDGELLERLPGGPDWEWCGVWKAIR